MISGVAQLSTVEEQARTDVVRACAEAAEARRERDDALKILRDLKVEEKEWERREEAWKASVRVLLLVARSRCSCVFPAGR